MNWRKWLDEFILAGKGILLATKEKRFWFGFIPSFLFFGTLINLLSSGTMKFEMMALMGFPKNLKILGESLISIFGVNQPFLDWLPVFAITLLQSTLIGLIVLLWNKKSESNKNSENIQKAGIITGLIALGAGCPTCGATLLTPLLGAIFSTGSLVAAGVISNVVTILVTIIAILSLKRLGEEVYVIIVNEKYLIKKANQAKEGVNS